MAATRSMGPMVTPMARGADQSALTIDLQENANAAAAVTCQEGTPRPVVGDRGRSRLWHDRLRGPLSRAPGTVCAGAAALDAILAQTGARHAEAPRRSRGLGACMVCGTHGSTLSTGSTADAAASARVNPGNPGRVRRIGHLFSAGRQPGGRRPAQRGQPSCCRAGGTAGGTVAVPSSAELAHQAVTIGRVSRPDKYLRQAPHPGSIYAGMTPSGNLGMISSCSCWRVAAPSSGGNGLSE